MFNIDMKDFFCLLLRQQPPGKFVSYLENISRGIRWSGTVARMGETRNGYVLAGMSKGKGPVGDVT
jgi:hypothetical protein